MDYRFESVPVGAIFTFDRIKYKKLSETEAEFINRGYEVVEFEEHIIVSFTPASKKN